MVYYPVIFGPVNQAVDGPTKPLVQIYHAFAGKRVRIKLLSWSGAVSGLGTGPTAGEPEVIRIDFGNELQANAMGAQSFTNSQTYAAALFMYPNAFYVDPIRTYSNDNAGLAFLVNGIQRAAKPPVIEGTLVGNTLTLTLNCVQFPRERVPTAQFGYILDEFLYYKAELDIEEIK